MAIQCHFLHQVLHELQRTKEQTITHHPLKLEVHATDIVPRIQFVCQLAHIKIKAKWRQALKIP